jgi:hypothetical protein
MGPLQEKIDTSWKEIDIICTQLLYFVEIIFTYYIIIKYNFNYFISLLATYKWC